MSKVIKKGYIYTMYGCISKYGEKIEIPKNCIAVPGFIDIHTHGGFNKDAMDGDVDGLKCIAKESLKSGTTSFYPTTLTESKENIEKSLKTIDYYMKNFNDYGAEVLGVHLEGPFLNKSFKGAHDEHLIVNPNIEDFKKFEETCKNIKIVTYAIENDIDFLFTKYLKSKNIVSSIGHSDSNFEKISEALKIRDFNITHFYNGCSSHSHRNPGVVTAGLYFDNIMIEMICDGIHVNKDVVKTTLKLKGSDKIILITDSMRARGLKDGIYKLGGLDVIKKGNEARLKSGNLAGSTISMNDAFKNIINYTNCSLEDAVAMTSTNASIRLGINNRKGTLDLGKEADICILDENLDVIRTYKKGKIVFYK